MRRKIQSRSAHVRPMVASAALLFCLLQSTPSFAQGHTVSHYFDGNNMKSYSVAIQTDRTMPSVTLNPIQCVKAGTIYGNFGGGPIGLGTPAVVHFVRTNELGRITHSVYYDAGGYAEERAVSIVGNGVSGPAFSATYYIVSLIRPFAGADDQIRIQAVDYTGQPVNNAAYIQATSGGGANYGSLHPLHAVYHNNQVYVCGYITKDPVALYPGAPSFATPKESFVLSYDPVSQTVTNRIAIQTVAATTVSDDYDMAMRITPMSNGNLHVTGSVNALRSGGLVTSGTMNMEFSPTLAPINTRHFAESQSPYHEYGVGLVETNGEYYVVGNNFYRGTGGGFDLFPTRPWVNWVSSAPLTSLDPGTASSRYHFDDNFEYVWALQAMPGTNAGEVRIVGHQTWEECSRGSVDQASPDNIQPFIADFQMMAVSGNVTGSNVLRWANYRNQTGTGNTGLPNSYWGLGRDMDIMAWNSTIAAREPGWGMVLTAPKWNAANNRLNFKSIRAEDNSLDVSACTTEVNQCSAVFTTENAVTNICTTTVSPFPVSIGIHALPAITWSPSSQVDCDNSAPHYRPDGTTGTGVTTLHDQSAGMEVYPNPASDHITLSLGGAIKDDVMVNVVLLNQTGQEIAKLYEGKAKTLNSNYTLLLPHLASGMYMLSVNTGGKNVFRHKLAVYP